MVGLLGVLAAAEGFNRSSSFVSAFSGVDSSLSLSLPVISVIGVVDCL